MLQVKTFTVNMLQENCYILSDETKEAVIIDDGAYYPEERQEIENYIEKENLKLIRLLDTHAHFDHVLGNKNLFDKYGIKADFHRNDALLYDTVSLQTQSMLGCKLSVENAPAGVFLQEGDYIEFGNHSLRVIETPGHTPGGICFYCEEEKLLFSGDSLFRQSIGRTDFPGGNGIDLINALKTKILTLPDDTKVLPGHGPSTSIKEEKEENIYFK